MSEEFALAYADSVSKQVCDDFSSDVETIIETLGAVPQEVEREFETFFQELRVAAAETRQLIAEIDALTNARRSFELDR